MIPLRKLEEHNNNYQPIKLKHRDISVSIVLPCFNVATSLPKVIQALNKQSYPNIEIIIVDDFSNENILLNLPDAKFSTLYIRHNERLDKCIARNTGILCAKGECVLILDPDIVLVEDAIKSFVTNYTKFGNQIFIGFREDIKDRNFNMESRPPSLNKDIRISFNYNAEKMHVLSIFGKETQSRIINIMDESNYLSQMNGNRLIGAWDLAANVTGHSIFFNRKSILEIGGFDESYRGWGFDDIAFGALAISNGFKIVPTIGSIGYHMMHDPHSGNEESKWKEFHNNQKQYFNWLRSYHTNIKLNRKINGEINVICR